MLTTGERLLSVTTNYFQLPCTGRPTQSVNMYLNVEVNVVSAIDMQTYVLSLSTFRE